MRAIQGTLGVFSLILLAFGVAAYALTRSFDLFVFLNLTVGLFALVAWLAAGRERIGAFLGERSTRYGANAVLYSALFVGVIAMFNFLGTRYSQRFDASEADVFSLSPQSKKVVKDLAADLEMIAFVEGGKDPVLEDLLKTYAHESDRVKYEMVDPDKSPDLAEKHGITNYNTLRVAYGEQATVVETPDEEKLTNAIIKVTQSSKKKICFVEGHGEPDTEDVESPRGYGALRTALLNENFDVAKLLLATQEKVPEDCHVLVVAAPEKPYFESEIKVLEEYLKNGGRAAFFFAARKGEELLPVIAPYGIQVGNDVVVDQVLRLFAGPALGVDPIATTYGTHPITEGFKQQTMYHLARSVSPSEEAKGGVETVSLVKTSASSWAESDVEGLFQRSEVSLDPAADKKGPVSIAAATTIDVEKDGEKKTQSRLVAFGSTDFVNNRMIRNFYNEDLAMNAIAWTAGEENVVSIRARSLRASRIQLTDRQAQQIFYLSVLLLPEMLLLAGIFVWAQRRGA